MGMLEPGDELQGWLSRAHDDGVGAVLRGCPSDSAEAAQVVHRILEPGEPSLSREELIVGTEAFTDPRIDRYWQLTATINPNGTWPAEQKLP